MPRKEEGSRHKHEGGNSNLCGIRAPPSTPPLSPAYPALTSSAPPPHLALITPWISPYSTSSPSPPPGLSTILMARATWPSTVRSSRPLTMRAALTSLSMASATCRGEGGRGDMGAGSRGTGPGGGGGAAE